jgi:hypothetical protein
VGRECHREVVTGMVDRGGHDPLDPDPVTIVFDGTDRSRRDFDKAWERAAAREAALVIEVTVSSWLRWWVALGRSAAGATEPSESELTLAVRNEAEDLAGALELARPVRWWVVVDRDRRPGTSIRSRVSRCP